MTHAPAVATLSDSELAFVTAILDLGGPQHAPEAALRAGLASTVPEAEYAAALLLSHPRIAKAITAEVRRRFDIATATAFQTLLEVCTNPRAPANARISAAQEILSRSEIGPIVSRQAVVKTECSIEDLLERLDREGRSQPGDGRPATTIDAVARHSTVDEPE